MRAVCVSLVFSLLATSALAQEQQPIHASMAKAAANSGAGTAAAPDSSAGHGPLFWSGLAVGIAGVTTAVLGTTAFRVEDSSTGNAPRGTYQACVAQKASNPIYANNQCDVLKGKNLKLLWGGAAIGAAGAAMMIGGLNTHAEIRQGAITIQRRLRF